MSVSKVSLSIFCDHVSRLYMVLSLYIFLVSCRLHCLHCFYVAPSVVGSNNLSILALLYFRILSLDCSSTTLLWRYVVAVN